MASHARQIQEAAICTGWAIRRLRSARHLHAAHKPADRVVKSVCPYCAVGCGQNVYVKDEKIIDIEGDPDSPISRGRSVSERLRHVPAGRPASIVKDVLYRRPYGNGLGKDSARSGHGHGGGTREESARRELAGQASKKATRCAARCPSPTWAAPRSITKRTISSRSCSPAWHYPDRKPGPYLTLLHGPRSGGKLWKRRRDHVPAGSAERGLHCDSGLQHGRKSSGGIPVGDESQRARSRDHPRRSALYAHQRRRRTFMRPSGRERTLRSSAA